MKFVQIHFKISSPDKNIIDECTYILEKVISSLNCYNLKKLQKKIKRKITMQRSPHIFKKSKKSFEYTIYTCTIKLYLCSRYICAFYNFMTCWCAPLKIEIIMTEI